MCSEAKQSLSPKELGSTKSKIVIMPPNLPSIDDGDNSDDENDN
jgi:hypothetical protein